jgi:hypothetical protein
LREKEDFLLKTIASLVTSVAQKESSLAQKEVLSIELELEKERSIYTIIALYEIQDLHIILKI